MLGDHRLEDIIDAAKRVADKVFQTVRQAAEEQLTASNSAGRLHSSSHIATEQRIFVEGYERLCIAAANRVAELGTQGVTTYLAPLENLLRQYSTPTFNEFLKYAAPGQVEGIVRNEANQRAHEMDGLLDRALRATLADFKLNFPADGSPVKVVEPRASRSENETTTGYTATVLKVMIASPSDVADERTIVREVVHEWNAVHSEDRSIVLMPVGWESHSSPSMGDRPQEIVNKQILRGCDLLIAVFWTKFGTPTGKADSGTAEEIEEHLHAGKPALIYFSSEPVRPESINPEQYKAVKAFETDMLRRGLVERYDTKSMFREKLSRQLAQTIIREFGMGGRSSAEELSTAVQIGRDVPPLSEEARELLIEAAKDKAGVVMRVQHMNGTAVQTNQRQFIQSDDARTQAKWRAAVDELEQLQLLEDRNGKGEVFFITNDGYKKADELAKEP